MSALRQPSLQAMWRALLVGEFAVISGFYILVALFVDRGMDARIYHRAVHAWLAGADPWTAEYAGVSFAAPPPTLLFIAPTAALPDDVAVAAMILLGVVASVFVLRHLGLPAYWLLFPPLVEGVVVGNPDIIAVALLLTKWSPLAVLAKIYAAVPLVLLGRWRATIIAAAMLLVTAPFLPWGYYLDRNAVSLVVAQAEGRSAFGGSSPRTWCNSASSSRRV